VLYGAALRQFEDLLSSAEASGYAGRPVPLFYALSQAGRAIVAAFGDSPVVDGHGLREHRTHDVSVPFLDRAVDRAPTKRGIDAFSMVAHAIGSPVFKGTATLGSIWAATPGAADLLLCDWDDSWCPPLNAELGFRDPYVAISLYTRGGHLRLPINTEQLRDRYPQIPRAATFEDSYGFGLLQDVTHVATVQWDPGDTSPEEELRGRLARTRAELHDDGILLPSINNDSDAMDPLMSWWVLLFALSIFARYHPTPWVNALDPDASELAVPLQALLDVAPDAVATLVWEAVLPHEPTPLVTRLAAGISCHPRT
jgi:hypothetical protein